MNAQEYWKSVHQVEANLPADAVWLYPMDSDTKGTHERTLDAKGEHTGPPMLVECDRRGAARRIVEKTHRMAREEEVKAYLERVETNSKKNIAKESTRAMKNITLSPEQFAQALRGVMPPPDLNPPPKKTAA